jgi:hypothetical protein
LTRLAAARHHAQLLEERAMALLKILGLAPPRNPDVLKRAERLAAHERSRAKAKAGPVAQALALRLEPAALAGLRDRTLAGRETAIAAKAAAGRVAEADRMLDAWVAEARAWADARDAFDTLAAKPQGTAPDRATLARLAQAPGGAAVLDALVDAVPDAAPPAAVAAALAARHGVVAVAPPEQPASAAFDPPAPPRSAKGLYRLLGKLPAAGAAAPVAIEAVPAGAVAGLPAPVLYCAAPGR